MASNWAELPIGQVVEIFDGPHATPAKVGEGPIFLGISNLVGGRLDLSVCEHVSEQDFTKWTRRVTPTEGDLVFSYETRLGEAALIPANLRCCLGRRMGLLRARISRVDPRFLLYAYLGPDFQETLRRRTIHGSTVDRIPLIEMPSFPIKIPTDLGEQRAIAHILGSLDDKIELNRRMNETLEAMARGLFKSWFVDFDPARAKAEGRTAQSSAIEALFPDSFEMSDLGEIPKGWSVQSLADVSSVYSGGTPSKSVAKYWNGNLPWISPKAMSSVHVDQSEESVTSAAVGNGTRLVPKGSVLVMVRGMGLHQGVRISQAQRDVTFNQDVKACVPKWGDGTFLLFALLNASKYLFSKVQASGHGTGVLPTDILEGLMFAIPPSDIRDQLTKPLASLNAKMAVNNQSILTLSALRDTLLPKLISGELRVKAAEKIVEAVV